MDSKVSKKHEENKQKRKSRIQRRVTLNTPSLQEEIFPHRNSGEGFFPNRLKRRTNSMSKLNLENNKIITL